MKIKEVVIYETSDGNTFKSKSGAKNHERKLAAQRAIERCDMTEEEIQIKLSELKDSLPLVRFLFQEHSSWTKWEPNYIEMIIPSLFDKLEKTTIYVYSDDTKYRNHEVELAREVGPEFTSSELHLDEDKRVEQLTELNPTTLRVKYVNKYSPEEAIINKLNNGTNLSESELRDLYEYFGVVYEERGDDGRWSRHMLTVYRIGDKNYALDWNEGLTENQENDYSNQLYEVSVEEVEVTVTKTIVKPIESK